MNIFLVYLIGSTLIATHSNSFVLMSKVKNYSFQSQLNLPFKSCSAHALFFISYYLRRKMPYISFFRYFHEERNRHNFNLQWINGTY